MWFLKALWESIIGTENKKARAEEIRMITSGFKELNDEYRKKRAEDQLIIMEQKLIIQELREQRITPWETKEITLDDEIKWHMEIIKLRSELMEKREEVYFMTLEIRKLKGERITPHKAGFFR
jgi:hypothetical protein